MVSVRTSFSRNAREIVRKIFDTNCHFPPRSLTPWPKQPFFAVRWASISWIALLTEDQRELAARKLPRCSIMADPDRDRTDRAVARGESCHPIDTRGVAFRRLRGLWNVSTA